VSVLNPALYNWMVAHFEKVRIANQGVAPKWRLAETDSATYPYEVETSTGHEHYVTYCPLCGYHRPTLWVSCLFLQKANLGTKERPKWHNFMNLACCYYCHAEGDSGGVVTTEVWNIGRQIHNRVSNELLQLFANYFDKLSLNPAPVYLAPAVSDGDLLEDPIGLPPMVPLNQLPPDHHAIRYLRGEGEGARNYPVDIDYLTEAYGAGYVQDWVFYADEQDRASVAHQRAYDRIVFPFYKHGRLVTWQGRVCRPDDERPRWLFPPGQGSHFFGWDYASRYEGVVLVEGAFDVVAAGPSSLGICTSNMSLNKCVEVTNTWKYVVIAIDPKEFRSEIVDSNGHKRSGHAHIIRQRMKGAGVTPVMLNWPNEEMDPSDMGPRRFGELLEASLVNYPGYAKAIRTLRT